MPLGVNLFTGGRLDLRPGGVAVVSQSGFLVRSALAAAEERDSACRSRCRRGNEAVCDLADYVAVLAADRSTTGDLPGHRDHPPAGMPSSRPSPRPVRPVSRCIALKLGRSDRARRIMQSHTGAIADASWVYDLAFREHGIIGADDIDELLDTAQLFAQIPADRRSPIRRIGMITTSGGVAALATDIAEVVGAPLPPLTGTGRMGARAGARRHREPAGSDRVRDDKGRADGGGVREICLGCRPAQPRLVDRRRRRRLEQNAPRTLRHCSCVVTGPPPRHPYRSHHRR